MLGLLLCAFFTACGARTDVLDALDAREPTRDAVGRLRDALPSADLRRDVTAPALDGLDGLDGPRCIIDPTIPPAADGCCYQDRQACAHDCGSFVIFCDNGCCVFTGP